MTDPCAAGSAAPLPDTLRATVLERVMRLDRRDRSVLMCASVIGLRFELAVLVLTAACEPGQVATALGRACALQLIEVDAAAPGHYAFRHALTRDVMYGELLAARTRPLHRRIARALERVRAGAEAPPLEEIAFHWWAAGDTRRGPRANELAGDRAAAVHAASVAQLHYRRALGLTALGSVAYARLVNKIADMQNDGAAV